MMINIKQILLYIGLVLCVLLQVCRSKAPQFCPSFCTCDLYEERNRAECSAKRLISANIEVPKAVEILDLSYNDITNIDSGTLKNFVHLVNLTVAHNALQIIHLDAFVALRSLQALDLSYNRLEYIDEHLLETNHQLGFLNLEGNKFMTLASSRPFLRSRTLRILNLRNSQISQINPELLSALPQLQQLDLAQNLFITLNSASFNAPRQLERLNLNENPLNCDRALAQMARVLRRRGIALSMSDCMVEDSGEEVEVAAADEVPMFERMQLIDSEATGSQQSVETTDAPSEEAVNVLDVWRMLPDSDESSAIEIKLDNNVCMAEHEKLCQRYRNCLERVSHMLFEQEEGARQFMNMPQTYTEEDVKMAFIIGGATGICVVICIITCTLCFKYLCESRSKRTSSRALPTVTARVSQQPRRSIPTRRSQPTRTIVRQPYGPQDNFISRLFGLPARHQYQRTISQNTATLIRRLSRSNLFNNRSERDANRHTAPHNDEDCEAAVSPGTVPATSVTLPTAPLLGHADRDLTRPETPPPTYREVVSTSSDGR